MSAPIASVKSRKRKPNGKVSVRASNGAMHPLTAAEPAVNGGPTVNLVELLDQTCAELVSSFRYAGRVHVLGAGSDTSRVRPHVADLVVAIVREAVSNAIKYSHPTGIPGKIAIACQEGPDSGITIDVTDDGVGLPENFDPSSDGGGGLQAMRALSDRLEARLTFKSTSLGLVVRLHVPHAALDRQNIAFVGAPGDRSRELLQALPCAIYTTDADGRLTFYNEAAAALWGRRPELGKDEFCGSWKLYSTNGASLAHDQCPMALSLKQKQPVRGTEAVLQRPDGTRVPFIPYPTPLFDDEGALVGAINMLIDISARKRDEEALAKHRDEQTALYRFTDALFRAGTLDDVYNSALEAITRALGCSRASVLLFDAKGAMKFVAWYGLSDSYRRAVEGHSPWTRDTTDPSPICIPDVAASDLPQSLKTTVAKEGIAALAFIPLIANGELIGKFMTYYGTPRFFSDADIDLAITVARQLGFALERMRLEEQRRHTEEASRLLASIIETSDDAIVSKDLDGVVTSWNWGAERVFGYTAEEMIGQHVTTLIPPDRHGEEPDILESIRRGERVEQYETVRRRKDGRLIDISLTVSAVRDATGKIVGASKIARDITERKQAQARQELLTREIQHRTKNLFAVVQAVVARSFAGKRTAKEAESVVLSRLHSLAQTHAMLIDREWHGADVAEVVRVEMSPYADRAQADGPSVVLNAKAAQNFALALHELATNAVKYGSLSKAAGRVHISWSTFNENGSSRFRFRWQEQGGPPVSPPTQKGFGTAVLQQVMGEYFDKPPRMNFAAEGLSYELDGALDTVTMVETPRKRRERG